MKYLGKITDDKDLVTKEYVDDSISVIDADKTYQGEITSSTDLSTLTNGVWGIGTASGGITHADFPTNDAYHGYLIQYNTTYKNQLLVAGKPSVSQLFHRRWLTNSSAFTAWLKVTDSSDLSSYMKKGVDYVTAGQNTDFTIGSKATAEGQDSVAYGEKSHAEGSDTMALGINSHAEGYGNKTAVVLTGGASSTTLSYDDSYTIPNVGDIIFCESSGLSSRVKSVDTTNKKITLDSRIALKALSSSTDTYIVTGAAVADCSHVEGKNNVANGYSSHAEGEETKAYGVYSHAEGYATQAGSGTPSGGLYSHAEGLRTKATANSSHAEGNYTEASGSASHSEGSYTTASGSYSHAEGFHTTAQRKSQHVFGEYNILDTSGGTTSRGDYVEIVGNGTADDAKSNARTLDWSGNEKLAGSITVGNSATMQYNSTDKSIDFVFI